LLVTGAESRLYEIGQVWVTMQDIYEYLTRFNAGIITNS
jgi:hypothetical protein